ncbi:MAG: FAD-binding protein [Steroidobacteraceae bacterium]
MHRRRLLAGAAALLALPFLSLLPPLASGSGNVRAAGAGARARDNGRLRRARPGEPEWPGAAAWDKLKADVGGNLIEGSPLLGACVRDGAGSSGCKDTLQNLRNPLYIGDQPGGTQVSGWVDAWEPAASAYVVAARNASDVVAAVNFARVNNLRLVVKGGGHSYQGTSNSPDSLLVWTRAMNRIGLHDGFVAQGCRGKTAPQPAVTLDAGAMWIDAYDAVTTKAGRYVQGGGCTTVGVAGLVQSGGFGSFSKGFGTAAASLLEARIVTADGVLRTVNPCQDAELYWALKGGGGGSWGVITEITLRTHDLPQFFGGAQGTVRARTDQAFRELILRVLSFYHDHLFNPHWGEQLAFGPDNTLQISMVCQGLDKASVEDVWRPLFDHVNANPDLSVTEALGAGAGPARRWWDAVYRESRGDSMIGDPRPGAPLTHAWWRGDQEQVGALLYGFESAWLPGSLLDAGKRGRLADALFAASRHRKVELHINKGLAGASAEHIAAAADTAMNPQVLSAFALAIIADGGRAAYPGMPGAEADVLAAARESRREVAAAMRELRAIAPAPGAYVSESDYFEAAWQGAFWGEHYSRLRAVKAKYDPEGLYFVHHGVGSEDWSGDGFVRRGG